MNETLTLPDNLGVMLVVKAWVFPYLAYFVGIVIRKVAMPRDNSPDLKFQLLMGIPVALVVVTPVISSLGDGISTNTANYLFTMGIIMEHGMIMHETLSKHLAEKIAGPAAAATPGAGA